MTQITIRQVEGPLAKQIRKEAAESGESMNALLLKLLRRHFLRNSGEGNDDVERNDLRQFQKGWIEDAECEVALREFDQIDKDDWK
ncbi:MAG: hypothetical protein L3J39_03845 [Verrucomicrobiales bacterium]|nr:hypothetical protein [Verrucomicrobiales bacterium]